MHFHFHTEFCFLCKYFEIFISEESKYRDLNFKHENNKTKTRVYETCLSE